MFKERFSFMPSYLCIMYAIFFLTYCLFLLSINSFASGTVLVVIPAIFFYPFLLTLIPAALGSAAIFATGKMQKYWQLLTAAILLPTSFIMHLTLLLDAGLYFRYNYHINPHVLNIFTTPGGFEGMGMRPNEIIMLAIGILLLAVFHVALLWSFMRFPKIRFIRHISWKAALAAVAVCGILFVTHFFAYAYSHFMMNPPPLLAAKAIPCCITGTAKGLFKSIGLKEPSRDAVRIKLSNQNNLGNYPQNPIIRQAERKKFNVVWLTCESLAARLYTPQIMPKTTAFADKAITFTNHYSGGNVTRQGVFSMFYGLPGNYWHAFLAARRGPVFIDWLLEDGYNFKCITSSKFTYPEFDQTVFFNIPGESLHSDSSGKSYARDQRNVKLLLENISNQADSGKPFFAFMFFESCHHPYSFPEEATLFPDYIEPFNAVQTTAKDGEAIFKRAANAAHHLDMRLGEVFQLLEKKNLLSNTIVVVAGDHGEEYYEKGHLGHSSFFNNEQTRTPLIIYYPGVKPQKYTGMSSHLDIVPMLAGFFGVSNPAEDYSCGIDLLAPDAPARHYALIANWDEVFFAGSKYKSLIPMDTTSFASQTITDSDDRELDDVDLFYREYNSDLIKVQRDLSRFTAPETKDSNSAGLWITLGIVLAAAGSAVIIRCCIRRKGKESC